MTHIARRCIVAGMLALIAAVPAKAEAADITLSFECISNNLAGDCAIGESQFFADITETLDGVDFVFYNTGPAQSVITEVYFRDPDEKLDFASFTFSSGVSYVEGCNPNDLPSLNGFRMGFCAEPTSPPAQNGVGTGESLTISFSFNSGYDFSHLSSQLESGHMAVGIRGQAFASGGSEAFVSKPPTSVPEPGSLLLLGIGALALGGRRSLQRLNAVTSGS